MEASAEISLSESHLLLFGKIVQHFAAHELLIRQVMGQVLGTEPQCITPLIRDLPFTQKCKALLELLRIHKVPLDQYDQVNFYLKRPLANVGLRDEIIHARWAAAAPPKRLQPASILQPAARIKPTNFEPASARDGRAVADGEYGYGIADLQEIAAALESNWKGFAAYLTEVSLARTTSSKAAII